MLEIREGRLGLGVHTRQPIEAGQLILTARGLAMPQRTRHTIQTDYQVHVDFPAPLRLLNHSCEPNCGLRIAPGSEVAELYALRPIKAGEELTWDYCTTENEIHFMTGPCLCGSDRCRGRITGFRDLAPERLEAYGSFVAEYLRPVATVSIAS